MSFSRLLLSASVALAIIPTIEATTFSNTGVITIPAVPSASNTQPASPYPSTINVSGLAGNISAVTLTLKGFHHFQQKDVDALLVGPTGATLVFMSDIGGAISPAPAVDVTFDDAAAALAPGTTITGAGPFTFKPTNNIIGTPSTDTWTSPAPAGPYNDAAPTGSATFFSIFGGTNPNGDWKLYIIDDIGGDNGACDGGWQLNITTVVAGSPTTTTITSSANPSLTTQAVTFTATVLRTSDSAPASGTVTFSDSTTGATLATNVALNGSGQAQAVANANMLTERRHIIVGTYTPAAGFLGSVGNMTQTVDFPTSNPSAGVFANTNSITVPEPALGTSGTALPYPSHITVSGLGTIGNVRVTLNGVTHSSCQDMDILLVGPGGQKMIVVSDTGNVASNVTVNFDDTSASTLATGQPWGAAGSTVSSKPADNTAGDTWPAPAPAGPYGDPSPVGAATFASVFNGASPNGVWSLYILDDAGGDAGTIAGGWSLTISSPPAITSANAATFTVGTNGSFTVTKTGLPVPTLSQTGALPTGVTFTAATGVLGGTPAAGTGGTYPITFTASNGVGSNAVQNFTLTVNQAPAITSANATTFTAGTAGNFNVIAIGFPSPTISLTSGSLPSGVNYGTGTLAGTPRVYGTFPLTFTASNGVGSNSVQSFSLVVNPSAAAVKSGAQIVRNVGGGYQLGFVGNPGTQYTVQYANVLPTPSGSWIFLSFQTADATGKISIIDTPPVGTAQRYYRAIIP